MLGRRSLRTWGASVRPPPIDPRSSPIGLGAQLSDRPPLSDPRTSPEIAPPPRRASPSMCRTLRRRPPTADTHARDASMAPGAGARSLNARSTARGSETRARLPFAVASVRGGRRRSVGRQSAVVGRSVGRRSSVGRARSVGRAAGLWWVGRRSLTAGRRSPVGTFKQDPGEALSAEVGTHLVPPCWPRSAKLHWNRSDSRLARCRRCRPSFAACCQASLNLGGDIDCIWPEVSQIPECSGQFENPPGTEPSSGSVSSVPAPGAGPRKHNILHIRPPEVD